MPARIALALAFVMLAGLALATPRVSVLALFPGKALVSVDGTRHLLSDGEVTPEGIRLVRADPRKALLEIDGRTHRLELNRSVGGSYAPARRAQVRITRNRRGMFTTAGAINGQPVDFLVDTGATLIAMNAADAARLGIDFRLNGTRIMVETASRPAVAYRLRLDRVRVGGIELQGVDAAVIDGASPRQPLLGMSFLGRVSMNQKGSVLVLQAPR